MATAVIQFFSPREPHPVGSMAVRVAADTPPEERATFIDLSFSLGGATTFSSVGRFAVSTSPGVHQVHFEDQQARAAKVVISGSAGRRALGLGRIGFIQSPQPRPGIGLQAVTATVLSTDTVLAGTDLLDWRVGGRFITTPASSWNSHPALLGMSADPYRSVDSTGRSTVLLGFWPPLGAVPIDRVILDVPPGRPNEIPRTVRLSGGASLQDSTAHLATIRLESRPGRHLVAFPARKLSTLKVEFLSAATAFNAISLGRVRALEAMNTTTSVLVAHQATALTTGQVEGGDDLFHWKNLGRFVQIPRSSWNCQDVLRGMGDPNAVWTSEGDHPRSTMVIAPWEKLGPVPMRWLALSMAGNTFDRRPRDIHVSIAPRPGATFESVGDYLIPTTGTHWGVALGGRRVHALKLELRDGHGSTRLSLKRLRLIEDAPSPDQAALVSSTSQIVSTASWLAEPRVARSIYGATVFVDGDRKEDLSSVLLDGNLSSRARIDLPAGGKRVILVDLRPFLAAPIVTGVGLIGNQERNEADCQPSEIQVHGSVVSSDRGFEPLAHFRVAPNPAPQVFRFPPRRARWIRLSTTGSYGSDVLRLCELGVFGRPSTSSTSTPVEVEALSGHPLERDSLAGRPNLLSSVRGARVTTPAVYADSGRRLQTSAAQVLFDGDSDFGWCAPPPWPAYAVLAMAKAQPIETLVLTPYQWPGGEVEQAHANRASLVTVDGGPSDLGPWTRMVTALMPQGWAPRQFHVTPTEARFLRLGVHTGPGREFHGLGRIAAYPSAGTTVISTTAELLSPQSGGNLIRFNVKGPLGKLCGPDSAETCWLEPPPMGRAELVWGFRGGAVASLGKLLVQCPSNQPLALPRTVEVLAGMEGVFGAFRSCAKADVTTDKPVASFDLGGVSARLVMVRFEVAPGQHNFAVNRIRLTEAPGVQHRIHDEPGLPAQDGDWSVVSSDVTTPGGSALADPAGHVESEPNGTARNATILTPGVSTQARIDPPGDVDSFSYEHASTGAFEVHVTQAPFLRIGARVRGPDGTERARFDPGTSSGPEAYVRVEGSPGSYHIDVTQPPSSILMIFDDSGSISPAYAMTRKAAEQFLDRVPAGTQVATSVIGRFQTPFTSDAASLKATTTAQLGRGGSSEATHGLKLGLDLLAQRPGNRALIILSDFQEDGTSETFWTKAATVGARIYPLLFAVDYWSQWRESIGNKQSIHAANIARATGGRVLHAPDAGAIVRLFDTVQKDLATSPPYRISADAQRLPGTIAVRLPERTVARSLGCERAILVILDASGSMKAKIKGGRKIDVAKKVVNRLIDELPDGVSIGLRVYGHRLSPKDARTCDDRELMIPVRPLDRAAFKRVVSGLPCRGETPMIGSVLDSVADFSGIPPGERTVVLISDGEETCKGSPQDLDRLPSDGVNLFRVDVVGFDIKDPVAIDQLQRVAQHGHGQYFPASDPAALASALARTTALDFKVFDDRGREVSRGRVGEPPLVVPAGRYEVRLGSQPPLTLSGVEVNPEDVVSIDVVAGPDGRPQMQRRP